MNCSRLVTLTLAAAICVSVSAAEAQSRARGRSTGRPSGGVVTGRAVPRSDVRGSRPIVVAPRYISPRYYYPYRRGLSVGIYSTFGYPYYGYPYYGFGYPYGYGYPYAYSAYGYGRYGYGGYGYGGYGYGGGYRGYGYGGVRIQDAPEEAQVFVDGYYVGIVDDFDGAFQHLDLEAGPHQIEIRAPGRPPAQFSVNVQPGRTMSIHTGIR
jgi:hypothetical protein